MNLFSEETIGVCVTKRPHLVVVFLSFSRLLMIIEKKKTTAKSVADVIVIGLLLSLRILKYFFPIRSIREFYCSSLKIFFFKYFYWISSSYGLPVPAYITALSGLMTHTNHNEFTHFSHL